MIFQDSIEYVIQSGDGYWSNDVGWVNIVDCADGYFGKDIIEYKYRLPIGKNVKWINRNEATRFVHNEVNV